MNPKDLVGAKKAPIGVVPPSLLPFVAPAMAVGAEKYGPFNWREQPVQAMTYAEAAMRHILAWIDGQDAAEDTGISHIAHAIAGLAILADAFAAGNLLDNRPVPGPTPDILRALDRSMERTEGEPVIYTATPLEQAVASAPFTGAPTCMLCRFILPEHALDCPFYMDGGFDVAEAMRGIIAEEFGAGDGPVYEGGAFKGVPVEQPDGCYEYRGKHVHPSVATPAVFRDIDRELDYGPRS